MVKKAMIKTYGCQMNVYDTQRMRDILTTLGYQTTNEMGQADVILLNTCHIREKAAEKVFSELGRVRLIQQSRQQQGKETFIGVTGCVAQGVGKEIFQRAPYVDMVFGPQIYHQLPEFLAEAKRRRQRHIKGPGRGVLDLTFPEEDKFDLLPEAQANGVSAFLSIQEGCDKFCHFCVVPYTRGAEYSRPVDAVIKEAKTFLKQGVREITLLGQNVNAYHGQALGSTKKESSLGELCYILGELDGLKRLRYMTSHPRDVDLSLVHAHRDVLQLMPFLHLPLQSGSDKMLKAMNRRHTTKDYLRVIDTFRNACPEMVFSSDFIVGYPGEKEEDVQQTLDVIEEVRFTQAYSFKFSPRPGTPGAALKCSLSDAVKSERLQRIQKKLRHQQQAFNRSCVGKTLPVLFDKSGRHKGQVLGRSPYLQAVHMVGGEDVAGCLLNVKIVDASLNSLQALAPHIDS